MSILTPPGLSPAQASGTYVAQDTALGGDLTGTLPNPGIAPGAIVDADISASAAIDRAKLEALEAWHVIGAGGEPAFQNSWAAFAGSPAFRLDEASQTVELRGLVQCGADPAANSVIFTLPAGYRPTSARFPVGLAYSGAYVPGNLQITTTGTVFFERDLANGALVYFDNIRFPIT